jgi:hypothetical protein
MDVMVLAKICTPNKHCLTDLALTDATNMMDYHVHNVFDSFLSLTRFCLEESIRVTAKSILAAVQMCSNMSHIEICAHSSTLQQQRSID